MKQYINLLKGVYLNIPSPLSVSVNLTNRYVQHCIYCKVGQGLVKTEKPLLALDDLKWIIDEMNRSGIPILSLGGEPFLFKDILEVIQYAHEFGIKSSTMTNGAADSKYDPKILPEEKIRIPVEWMKVVLLLR